LIEVRIGVREVLLNNATGLFADCQELAQASHRGTLRHFHVHLPQIVDNLSHQMTLAAQHLHPPELVRSRNHQPGLVWEEGRVTTALCHTPRDGEAVAWQDFTLEVIDMGGVRADRRIVTRV
jgi:hypothetical protein